MKVSAVSASASFRHSFGVTRSMTRPERSLDAYCHSLCPSAGWRKLLPAPAVLGLFPWHLPVAKPKIHPMMFSAASSKAVFAAFFSAFFPINSAHTWLSDNGQAIP